MALGLYVIGTIVPPILYLRLVGLTPIVGPGRAIALRLKCHFQGVKVPSLHDAEVLRLRTMLDGTPKALVVTGSKGVGSLARVLRIKCKFYL